MLFYNFEYEYVVLVKWFVGEIFKFYKYFGGEEIFVLLGIFKDEYGVYLKGIWLCNFYMS